MRAEDFKNTSADSTNNKVSFDIVSIVEEFSKILNEF
jgi:hypothetical protein